MPADNNAPLFDMSEPTASTLSCADSLADFIRSFLWKKHPALHPAHSTKVGRYVSTEIRYATLGSVLRRIFEDCRGVPPYVPVPRIIKHGRGHDDEGPFYPYLQDRRCQFDGQPEDPVALQDIAGVRNIYLCLDSDNALLRGCGTVRQSQLEL
jgi:hypothetical protein